MNKIKKKEKLDLQFMSTSTVVVRFSLVSTSF